MGSFGTLFTKPANAIDEKELKEIIAAVEKCGEKNLSNVIVSSAVSAMVSGIVRAAVAGPGEKIINSFLKELFPEVFEDETSKKLNMIMDDIEKLNHTLNNLCANLDSKLEIHDFNRLLTAMQSRCERLSFYLAYMSNQEREIETIERNESLSPEEKASQIEKIDIEKTRQDIIAIYEDKSVDGAPFNEQFDNVGKYIIGESVGSYNIGICERFFNAKNVETKFTYLAINDTELYKNIIDEIYNRMFVISEMCQDVILTSTNTNLVGTAKRNEARSRISSLVIDREKVSNTMQRLKEKYKTTYKYENQVVGIAPHTFKINKKTKWPVSEYELSQVKKIIKREFKGDQTLRKFLEDRGCIIPNDIKYLTVSNEYSTILERIESDFTHNIGVGMYSEGVDVYDLNSKSTKTTFLSTVLNITFFGIIRKKKYIPVKVAYLSGIESFNKI